MESIVGRIEPDSLRENIITHKARVDNCIDIFSKKLSTKLYIFLNDLKFYIDFVPQISDQELKAAENELSLRRECLLGADRHVC
jgi:hypothetical protein